MGICSVFIKKMDMKNQYDRTIPYNSLPELPLEEDILDKEVYYVNNDLMRILQS